MDQESLHYLKLIEENTRSIKQWIDLWSYLYIAAIAVMFVLLILRSI